MILAGDCVEIMAGMEPECIDAIVTDPPYGLGFMGKEWDSIGDTGRGARARAERAAEVTPVGRGHVGSKGPYLAAGVDSLRSAGMPFQVWSQAWATEALRVLKPGGYLLAFGGTRTFHRLTCAIEDAGFEIRDCLSWMYGSGFPKSLDVSKAIDKGLKVEGSYGEPKSEAHAGWIKRGRMRADGGHDGYQRPWMGDEVAVDRNARQYVPGTPAAQQWQGWGTALKPAWEPIIMARKPLVGTVAANVLKFGTGAINVDASRISTNGEAVSVPQSDPAKRGGVVGADLGISRADREKFQQAQRESAERTATLGRWPANVVLDEEAAAMLDEQSGELSAGTAVRHNVGKSGGHFPCGAADPSNMTDVTYGGSGGASRFFYCAKASSAERSRGLAERNTHPTVKPLKLMTWLVRMVTPPDGTVLDPFLGSGSTALAAIEAGFRWTGIELNPEYIAIAEQRCRRSYD